MSLRITNEYGELPPFTNWHIKKSLEWIPPLDFYGIEHIRLVDKRNAIGINTLFLGRRKPCFRTKVQSIYNLKV